MGKGSLIDKNVFKRAHEIGMRELAEKSGLSDMDKSQEENYFNKVEEALKKIWPDLSVGDRVMKRRDIYFNRVLGMINEGDINQDMINKLKEMKVKYRIGLITTVIDSLIDKFLEKANLNDLFDVVYASKPNEKDDKKAVFERFIKENNKPVMHISDSKRDRVICEALGISIKPSHKL
ncbi:MAG: HAD hydrolase-like protein [Candidatus Nanoarchaeia archaeon]